ncbi:hypothetical protein O3Q51_11690 [Cryomorphaceae bacterium 1068]|nr:hypothetical protein [Cryomorphaceae bacterium 1068]
MNRLIHILAMLMGLVLLSCDRDIPFEKNKWVEHADRFYPYRNLMVEDLLESEEFKGKSLKEVFEILGTHDDWCDHTMYELKYQILVGYGSDSAPIHTKYLVFELNPADTLIDSNTVVTNIRVDEWKK